MMKTNLRLFSRGKNSSPRTETVVEDLPRAAACSTFYVYGNTVMDTSRLFLLHIKRLDFALLDYHQAPWQDTRTTLCTARSKPVVAPMPVTTTCGVIHQ